MNLVERRRGWLGSLLTVSFASPVVFPCSDHDKVGMGTGISPIVAFLQARESALLRLRRQRGPQAALRPCLVYASCHSSGEALFYEQLQEWANSGVITGLHVAVSHDEGWKVRFARLDCGVFQPLLL